MKQERITITHANITFLDIELIPQTDKLTIIVHKIHPWMKEYKSTTNDIIFQHLSIKLGGIMAYFPGQHDSITPILFTMKLSDEDEELFDKVKTLLLTVKKDYVNVIKTKYGELSTLLKEIELKINASDEIINAVQNGILNDTIDKEIAYQWLQKYCPNIATDITIINNSSSVVSTVFTKFSKDKIGTINDILLMVSTIKSIYDDLIKDVDKLETEKLPKVRTWTDYLYYGSVINHIYTSIKNLISEKDYTVNSRILELLVMYVTARKLYQMFMTK